MQTNSTLTLHFPIVLASESYLCSILTPRFYLKTLQSVLYSLSDSWRRTTKQKWSSKIILIKCWCVLDKLWLSVAVLAREFEKCRITEEYALHQSTPNANCDTRLIFNRAEYTGSGTGCDQFTLSPSLCSVVPRRPCSVSLWPCPSIQKYCAEIRKTVLCSPFDSFAPPVTFSTKFDKII